MAKKERTEPRHIWPDAARLPEQWAKTEFGEWMAQGAGGYQERRLEQNVLDFDDVMLWSIRLLHEHEDAHEKHQQQQYEHLLVDGYQGTNLPQ